MVGLCQQASGPEEGSALLSALVQQLVRCPELRGGILGEPRGHVIGKVEVRQQGDPVEDVNSLLFLIYVIGFHSVECQEPDALDPTAHVVSDAITDWVRLRLGQSVGSGSVRNVYRYLRVNCLKTGRLSGARGQFFAAFIDKTMFCNGYINR